MSKALNIIIIILLFIGFFEIGIFSSYTIVTSEIPDLNDLIDFQVNTVKDFLNPENINEVLIKDPNKINISNKKEVALSLESLSQVDGINVESINITTYNDTSEEKIGVKIEALGYSAPNSTSGQIIISQNPEYKVIATGEAKYKEGGYKVDAKTIAIESILKLY
ncbi:hypothetical protein [Methanobrevibacter sp. DSM 116169]|uniref:hypothetical protein n=1 Tax=Methanobrevibacter sp. DSM 116169 TaxID=3242727 RepID=UPI0038FBEF3A